ncbi:MAG: TIGR02221 family CRISPR-associated protein, partial [Pyrinomonadaceae bacterium]|nr:TIGR02221 family CRISPR-associated protein [Pyrinomonadaceae bacterium]
MTALVSFIGKGSYLECEYSYKGEKLKTHLFVEAAAKFFDPERIIVFYTAESKEAKRDSDSKTYIEQIKEKLKNKHIEEQEIKGGKSEEELWEIFDKISSSLKEGESVVFDITHAFRSIPLICLLVIALLRETKNIKLEAVVYGAFEAKDAENRVPVFDLTPFIELFDWITATRQFKETGNAKLLTEVLQRHDEKKLKKVLEALSESLRMLRSREAVRKSRELLKNLDNPKNLERIKTKPATQLLELIRESYKNLALENPEENILDFIKTLLELADWYFDKGQYVQSIAIVRELIPTIVCHRLLLNPFNRKEREEAEKYLNKRENEQEGEEKGYDWKITGLPEEMKNIWRDISALRNDVLHAGFNENPIKSGKIIENLKNFIKKLKSITENLVPAKIILLNTSILTGSGVYEYKQINIEEARRIAHNYELESAVGHEVTAEFLSKLLGVNIEAKRIEYHQKPGETALVFKLLKRLPEGKLPTKEELEKSEYEFGLLR